MLGQHPIIGFIPTADADRARHFYVHVLHLDFVSDDQFALVVKSHCSMIRIARTPDFKPAPYTILGWQVPDIDTNVRALTAAGVAFVRYAFLEQDDLGIWTSPTGSRVAWFNDPDGNLLSLSQH